MNFVMIISNQNMETEQNYVILILTVSLFILKLKIFNFANDVKRWFDTSNLNKNDERLLPIGKNKKVIGLFKFELSGKIMTEFVAQRAKAYTYSMKDGSEHKKAKGTKERVIKGQLMFGNYKDCFLSDKITLKS